MSFRLSSERSETLSFSSGRVLESVACFGISTKGIFKQPGSPLARRPGTLAAAVFEFEAGAAEAGIVAPDLVRRDGGSRGRCRGLVGAGHGMSFGEKAGANESAQPLVEGKVRWLGLMHHRGEPRSHL